MSFRVVALIPACLLLAGCHPLSAFHPYRVVFFQGVQAPAKAVVGQPVKVTLQPNREAVGDAVLQVETSVDEKSTPATVNFYVTMQTGTTCATCTAPLPVGPAEAWFTPTRTGRYHLEVEQEITPDYTPLLGRTKRDIGVDVEVVAAPEN
jgi:hypothetical protein